MKKTISITILLAFTVSVLAGCTATDVVLKYSPSSFEEIVNENPNLVNNNTKSDYYYLTVDGETTLKISRDYKLTGFDDIMIETPLKPFVDAGLDVSKLGDGYKAVDNMFYLTSDYGSGTGIKNTVTDSLFDSVSYDRSILTYHQELNHYGIKLTAGKFEWAKDYTTNDKDIVFVIKVQPLKDFGVDVNHISGWTFTTMQDTDGSNVDVLLKAYNLDSKKER